jgi:steroid delta-isomerase-like uncharacterized protein
MTAESNKQVVADFYGALISGKYDDAAAMCHEDFIFYPQVDTARAGAAGFMEAEKRHLDAFGDSTMDVEVCIAEGDRVGAYVIFEGDQRQDYYGVPPAGAHLRMSMFNLFTFRDGLIVEKRAHYDRLDHIEQLRSGSA